MKIKKVLFPVLAIALALAASKLEAKSVDKACEGVDKMLAELKVVGPIMKETGNYRNVWVDRSWYTLKADEKKSVIDLAAKCASKDRGFTTFRDGYSDKEVGGRGLTGTYLK